MSPFSLHFANFWGECLRGRVEMRWQHAGRKDAGSVPEAVGVGMVLWPDQMMVWKDRSSLPHNTISRQHPTCNRASLKACSMKACICLHLYPHCSLLSYLVYAHWQISIWTLFFVVYAHVLREIFWCTFQKLHVLERLLLSVRRLCLLCAEITICFSSNEKYMLLKSIVYS